jgi:hypothetical protein
LSMTEMEADDCSSSSLDDSSSSRNGDEATTTTNGIGGSRKTKLHYNQKENEESILLEEAALLPFDHEKNNDSSTSSSPQDVLSRHVMQGSRGWGLYCIMSICTCMFCCSFLLLFYFGIQEGHHVMAASAATEAAVGNQMTMTTTGTTSLLPPLPTYQSTDFCPTPAAEEATMMMKPLGHRLWQFQIHVVQNLVHASLVGSAAIVAVVRGDFLWMTYVRNVGFFFVPVGICYVVVDTWSLCFEHSVTFGQVGPRLVLASLTALAGLGALLDYSRVFFRIRHLLQARVHDGFQHRSRSTSSTPEEYPLGLAMTPSEAGLATVIYLCATLVQLMAWLYYATTLFEWMFLTTSCPIEGADTTGTTAIMTLTPAVTPLHALQQFEMSYSSGSHQALLISLFFLAATYPRDLASAGGALLTSTWRLTTGIGALTHLLTENSIRSSPLWSWVNASVEVTIMLPIWIASLILVSRILQRQVAMKLPSQKDSEKMNDGLCFSCPTALQISTSSRYTPEQQKGATLLKNGTALLLTELTVECLVMLRLNHIGTNMTHEIYKWYVLQMRNVIM